MNLVIDSVGTQMDEHKTPSHDCDRTKETLFELVERFRQADQPEEARRLGELVGLLIFGGDQKP